MRITSLALVLICAMATDGTAAATTPFAITSKAALEQYLRDTPIG